MTAEKIDNLRLLGPLGMGKVIEAEMLRIASALRLARPGKCRKPRPGTVVWPYSEELAQAAYSYARCPSRIHHDLVASDDVRLEPLHESLMRLRCHRVLLPEDSVKTFSIVCKRLDGFEAGIRQAIGAVKNAIVESAAEEGRNLVVSPDEPDVTLALTMLDDTLLISRLHTLEAMSQRGWRTERTEAPLRENVAACLLMLARFDARREALIEPMCGSGTIAIEAALMANGSPRIAGHGEPLFPAANPTIWASDSDQSACEITARNAERAGVTLEPRCQEYASIEPGQLPDGLIIANLPYGDRLEVEDLRKEVLAFEAWCHRHENCRGAMLVPVEFNPRFLRDRPKMDKTVLNGQIKTRFLVL